MIKIRLLVKRSMFFLTEMQCEFQHSCINKWMTWKEWECHLFLIIFPGSLPFESTMINGQLCLSPSAYSYPLITLSWQTLSCHRSWHWHKIACGTFLLPAKAIYLLRDLISTQNNRDRRNIKVCFVNVWTKYRLLFLAFILKLGPRTTARYRLLVNPEVGWQVLLGKMGQAEALF